MRPGSRPSREPTAQLVERVGDELRVDRRVAAQDVVEAAPCRRSRDRRAWISNISVVRVGDVGAVVGRRRPSTPGPVAGPGLGISGSRGWTNRVNGGLAVGPQDGDRIRDGRSPSGDQKSLSWRNGYSVSFERVTREAPRISAIAPSPIASRNFARRSACTAEQDNARCGPGLNAGAPGRRHRCPRSVSRIGGRRAGWPSSRGPRPGGAG